MDHTTCDRMMEFLPRHLPDAQMHRFLRRTLPLGKQTTCYTLLSMASMAFGLRFV